MNLFLNNNPEFYRIQNEALEVGQQRAVRIQYAGYFRLPQRTHPTHLFFHYATKKYLFFVGQIRRNECERYFNHFANISVDEKNNLLVCMLFGEFNLKEKVRIHIYS